MAQISKEYAEALFALACENGKEGRFMEALEEVGKIFEEAPEYPEFLASPSIPLQERLNAIEAAFGDAVPEYLLSWLELLCEKGRIGYFSECVKEYRALLNAKQSVVTAKVTSAVALTDKELEALKQKLEKISGNTILPVCSVDPALLGGVVVEIGGKVIDGSLRHRLQRVKEVMEQ